MSDGMRLAYVNGHGGRKEFCLAISVAHMLDTLCVEDTRELVGYAVASGQLLKLICRQVAATHDGPNCDPAADVLLDDRTITEMRQALMPLLSDAHAKEMATARAESDRCREARDTLRSLAHIRQMMRDEPRADVRREQWDDQWSRIDALFPEYAPKP